MADTKRQEKINAARRSQPLDDLKRKADKAVIRHRGGKCFKTSPEQTDLSWAIGYRGTQYLGQVFD